MPQLPWPLRDAWLSRLVVRAQRGDREAFRALYQALYAPVSGYVRRRVPARADAEDVIGQVFFRLLEGLARIDPKRGSVLAYALQAARNALVDQARGRGAHVSVQASEDESLARVDGAAGPLEQLVQSEQEARVRAELSRLDPETRELLVLRYVDGLRHPEIAQLLGLSEAAVRQRSSRAVRELRARLNETDPAGALTHDG
ncbi:sigma-70 family RNA polymerase sigma factor [Aggregicoccus sp. 17bor-14]|uniref:RNA polymerase sigma factor n=1 Tax=Myxococcaceae TaxID=31 RepID=UPI00129CBFF9|nr:MULTISPECIES: sigma-70 family RNA polymerase sigma factor [Myxococcaceae]MBF5041816.1 sigma-70 family RNA polymerase sigma factor [Simulacricoccus sp. 17bor-14]MRI87597.1 sigma-70 family RNA polymerase sigma factor [Aggregicoccus sp. 17bor-14]